MSTRMLPPLPVTKDACTVYYLGTVDYRRAGHLQEQLRDARHQGEISHDILLILQHLPVLAVGKSGYKPEHVLVTEERLKQEGIPVCHSSRGGGITYHGPGQLIGYPIFDLKRRGLTVRRYLYNLEEVVIKTLARFDIPADRAPDAPGVWVNGAEIASIGIHVSHGITTHGFTLNVSTDLRRFGYVAVCGVPDKKITSVAQVSDVKPSIEDFINPIVNSFNQVFNLDIQPGEATLLNEYGDRF